MIDEASAQEQLAGEGYANVYIHEDGPGTMYPEHSHDVRTAHIIVRGQMILTVNDETDTYGPGDRVDVPAHAPHTAQIGPEGCRYIIGE